jgi:hypothetical protein
MIEAERDEQRFARPRFARGIMALMRGDDSTEAHACARNVAEVLVLHANSLTDNKWGR